MGRYLVIQLARFGDVLQSTRLVRTLMARGETHLCVESTLAPLAAMVYPGLTVHAVRAHVTEGAGSDADGVLTHNWRVFAELAHADFSAVYNLNFSGLNQAMACLFDPSIVHGYRMQDGQLLRSPWLRLAFRWTGHRRSAPINLVDMWAGLTRNPMAPTLCNPPGAPGGRGLGVVLAGRHARRTLPVEVLAGCVRALCVALDGPPVYLFGSAAERPIARRLLDLLPSSLRDRVCDLSGRTDWAGLCEALTGLDALLTPDTGTMHLAAHLGVPVHGVFLSSAWGWETGPYGLGHTLWQAATPCAPCAEAQECPHNRRCLEAFHSPALLHALSRPHAGSGHTAPAALWKLQSAFDELGLVWLPQPGPECPAMDDDMWSRAAQRAVLAEYCGLGLAQPLPAQALGTSAMTLYHEADWMLPELS